MRDVFVSRRSATRIQKNIGKMVRHGAQGGSLQFPLLSTRNHPGGHWLKANDLGLCLITRFRWTRGSVGQGRAHYYCDDAGPPIQILHEIQILWENRGYIGLLVS